MCALRRVAGRNVEMLEVAFRPDTRGAFVGRSAHRAAGDSAGFVVAGIRVEMSNSTGRVCLRRRLEMNNNREATDLACYLCK